MYRFFCWLFWGTSNLRLPSCRLQSVHGLVCPGTSVCPNVPTRLPSHQNHFDCVFHCKKPNYHRPSLSHQKAEHALLKEFFTSTTLEICGPCWLQSGASGLSPSRLKDTQRSSAMTRVTQWSSKGVVTSKKDGRIFRTADATLKSWNPTGDRVGPKCFFFFQINLLLAAIPLANAHCQHSLRVPMSWHLTWCYEKSERRKEKSRILRPKGLDYHLICLRPSGSPSAHLQVLQLFAGANLLRWQANPAKWTQQISEKHMATGLAGAQKKCKPKKHEVEKTGQLGQEKSRSATFPT